MAKMTQAQMKELAKTNVIAMLNLGDISTLEQVGNCEYAIPTEVNGQEIWVEIKATCKNWYDTKTTDAYDPFVKQSEYQDILAERKAKAKAAAEKKAKKTAKSKAKSE